MSAHVAVHAGRRPRRFTLAQNHEMNVTPFVDVLLVLLIVFMIAAPLATTSIGVDIAAGGAGWPSMTPIGVRIDDAGAVFVECASRAPSASNLARLPADLARAGAGPHAWIVISGAPHTRYGAFMAVLDRLHGAGFTDVTLAAKGG